MLSFQTPWWLDPSYWSPTSSVIILLWLIAIIGPYVWASRNDTSIAMATVISLLFGFIVQVISLFIWQSGSEHMMPHFIFGVNTVRAGEFFEWHRFLSSAWLHDIGNFTHVLSNCLIIALVGVPLEQRLGRSRFAIVYLISAIGGSITWYAAQVILVDPNVNASAWGASGAAYGLLGAYIVCWPKDKIEFPLILIRPWPVEMIAGIYIFIEIWRSFTVYGMGTPSGIAHSAHIGGFFFAAAIARFLAKSGPVKPFSKDGGPSQENIGKAVRQSRKQRMAEITDDPWDGASENVAHVLAKLRAEGDELETREAWLDALCEVARCPQCDGALRLFGIDDVPQVECELDSGHLRWP